MNALPRISIVTPSFNQATFLETTIESVLAARHEGLEYLVVDGGSSDGSAEIIRRHADRLAFWCSEKDGGAYDAVNKGFARATGDVLGWLNSDDVYFPWTLRTVATIFAELPEVSWLTSLRPAFADWNGFVYDVHRIHGFSKETFDSGLHLEEGGWPFFGFIQQEGTFFRKSLLERVGGRIDLAFPLAGDFDLWARFFRVADLYGTPAPLAAFRVQRGQRSRDKESYLAEARASLGARRDSGKWTDARDAVQRASSNSAERKYDGLRVVRAEVDSPESRWRVEKYQFPEGV